MAIVAHAPDPRFVLAPDGTRLATYEDGDPDGPVVLALHGFGSSASANWWATGWARELTRSGHRMLALDHRGHGVSGKPHDPAAYTMAALVADVQAVLDTFLVDEAAVVGYSLGARVGWRFAVTSPHLVSRAVLGGIPDGLPLTRFQVDEALAFARDGSPVQDRLTRAYVDMARGIRGNDLEALVALVAGMRNGEQPDPADPPQQPVLFATGSEDAIIDASRRLAAATPRASFFAVPGRNHFNAPTSRAFRDRALAFLAGDTVGG
jgi:pimeloyl-ACP methyl ester carboxylesterase